MDEMLSGFSKRPSKRVGVPDDTNITRYFSVKNIVFSLTELPDERFMLKVEPKFKYPVIGFNIGNGLETGLNPVSIVSIYKRRVTNGIIRVHVNDFIKYNLRGYIKSVVLDKNTIGQE